MDFKSFIDKPNADIMPLFYTSESFDQAVEEMSQPYVHSNIAKVVGLESRGFILGGAIAYRLNAGFVAVRKADHKMYGDTLISDEFVDYTGTPKQLEIQIASLQPGDRILIVDDWFETGNQIRATLSLLLQLKVEIVGISVVIDETPQEVKDFLAQYNYHYLVGY